MRPPLLLLLLFYHAFGMDTSLLRVHRNKAFVRFSRVTSFLTSSEPQCIFKCVTAANSHLACAAVQYQADTGLCVSAPCANVQLQAASPLQTVYMMPPDAVLNDSTCYLPKPLFDWMMTDVGGFSNRGSLLPGLTLSPVIYGTTSPWSVTYTPSLSQNAGQAVLFPGQTNYLFMTTLTNISLSLVTDSLTIFCYYWLQSSVAPDGFSFLEFGLPGYNLGPHFWYHLGGFYYNFGFNGCVGGCNGYPYKYTPVLNTWTTAAIVYNVSSKTFTHYLNGSAVSISGTANFVNTGNWNYVVIGGRPGFGNLPGSIYCVKVYREALTADQIQSLTALCQ